MQQRIDDGSVSDSETLWRRVAVPDWFDAVKSQLNSPTFADNHSQEVSVHRAELTTLESIFEKFPDIIGVAEISASFPRSLGCRVIADATDEDPSHALICPGEDEEKIHKKVSRRMARQAKFIPRPSG